MKYFAFFVVFVFVCIRALVAQSQERSHIIGINPAITVEPYYKKGECDINIIPLVYQLALSNRIDFRITSIVNFGIRNSNSAISHLGGQMAIPVFLKPKNRLLDPSKGFFLAPGLGVTRNRMEKHTNAGIWLEPGYNLFVKNKWSISFGFQMGATHFNYDYGKSKWGSHFGAKIIIGQWI